MPLNSDGTKVAADCVSKDNATYTDCKNMVTVIAGSPGCREKTSKGKSPVGVVVFDEAYGYGHLTVYNATTIKWEWEQLKAGPEDGTAFYDSFTLVQTRA